MLHDDEESAKILNKSLKRVGSEYKSIVKVVVEHTNERRQIIKEKYLTLYGHQLSDDFKNDTNSSFMKAISALFMLPYEYEAQCIRNAITGFGTNEKVCIQILCTKEADDIQLLKHAYKKLYNTDLEKDLEKEEGGPLGRIFRSLAQGLRPKCDTADLELAKEDATELYNAGQGRVGTDELEFVRVLCTRSYEQLNVTFDEFFKRAQIDIEKAIQNGMSGDLERACLAIVKCVRNRPGYYAAQLHEAMKGILIKHEDIIRILVTRSEIDLDKIKEAYKQIFETNLEDVIKKKLSGHFEYLFLELMTSYSSKL